MEKLFMSWTGFDEIINDICRKIYRSGAEILKVYGIPRGGLVPAVAISHRLGVPLTDTLGPHTLLVDDISDSGRTFEKLTNSGRILQVFPHFYTASIYIREGTVHLPNFYGLEIKDTRWIVFPWEVKPGDFHQIVEV